MMPPTQCLILSQFRNILQQIHLMATPLKSKVWFDDDHSPSSFWNFPIFATINWTNIGLL